MRLRYQANKAQEINHLISCQPSAMKAVRLQALVPSKSDLTEKNDTLEKLAVSFMLHLLICRSFFMWYDVIDVGRGQKIFSDGDLHDHTSVVRKGLHKTPWNSISSWFFRSCSLLLYKQTIPLSWFPSNTFYTESKHRLNNAKSMGPLYLLIWFNCHHQMWQAKARETSSWLIFIDGHSHRSPLQKYILWFQNFRNKAVMSYYWSGTLASRYHLRSNQHLHHHLLWASQSQSYSQSFDSLWNSAP